MEATTAAPRGSEGHRPRAAASPLLPARLLRLASDERLVALVRRGSEGAFEAVYERHHRALLSFCRHMLASREEAEDAVQHAFIAAYRDLLGSDRPIALRAWLFTIARNRCLTVLRARREHEDVDDFTPATEGLAAQVERREDLRAVLADLALLPEDQRAALLLAEVGALSHSEVAGVIGVPAPKVKALVFQARSALATSRVARETPCAEIREELAGARGAALRRAPLRGHLRVCAGCREFRDEVRRQRSAIAVLLPVAPTAALKLGALPFASAGGGAAAGAAATGAGLAGSASVGGVAAKGLVAIAVAAGAAGGVVAVKDHQAPARPVSPGSGVTKPASYGAPGASAEHRRAPGSALARRSAARRAAALSRSVSPTPRLQGAAGGSTAAMRSLDHRRSAPVRAHGTPSHSAGSQGRGETAPGGMRPAARIQSPVRAHASPSPPRSPRAVPQTQLTPPSSRVPTKPRTRRYSGVSGSVPHIPGLRSAGNPRAPTR